jgi:hypothetical protein
MECIRIPTTLSPHIVNGVARGYYVLAQKIFPDGAPVLRRAQFIGFCGNLILTFASPNEWDTLMKMGVQCQQLLDQPVSWLAASKLWPMAKGFRSYIPGSILKPRSNLKITCTGIVKKHLHGAGVAPIFYLEIPSISADVLMGRDIL